MEKNKPRWSNKLKYQYRSEGEAAFESGLPATANPYEQFTPEYDLWGDGHYNAGDGHKAFMAEQSLLDDLYP